MQNSRVPVECQKEIRAVLLSQTTGIPITKFEQDYFKLTNSKFRFQHYGFQSAYEMLKALPDLVRFEYSEMEGLQHLFGVPDPDSYSGFLPQSFRRAQMVTGSGDTTNDNADNTANINKSYANVKDGHTLLVCSLKGEYSLVYRRNRSQEVTTQGIMEKFREFDINDCNIIDSHIFLRFRDRKNAIRCMGKYGKSLGVHPAKEKCAFTNDFRQNTGRNVQRREQSRDKGPSNPRDQTPRDQVNTQEQINPGSMSEQSNIRERSSGREQINQRVQNHQRANLTESFMRACDISQDNTARDEGLERVHYILREDHTRDDGNANVPDTWPRYMADQMSRYENNASCATNERDTTSENNSSDRVYPINNVDHTVQNNMEQKRMADQHNSRALYGETDKAMYQNRGQDDNTKFQDKKNFFHERFPKGPKNQNKSHNFSGKDSVNKGDQALNHNHSDNHVVATASAQNHSPQPTHESPECDWSLDPQVQAEVDRVQKVLARRDVTTQGDDVNQTASNNRLTKDSYDRGAAKTRKQNGPKHAKPRPTTPSPSDERQKFLDDFKSGKFPMDAGRGYHSNQPINTSSPFPNMDPQEMPGFSPDANIFPGSSGDYNVNLIRNMEYEADTDSSTVISNPDRPPLLPLPMHAFTAKHPVKDEGLIFRFKPIVTNKCGYSPAEVFLGNLNKTMFRTPEHKDILNEVADTVRDHTTTSMRVHQNNMKMYAFVTFDNVDDAKCFVGKWNGKVLNDRKVFAGLNKINGVKVTRNDKAKMISCDTAHLVDLSPSSGMPSLESSLESNHEDGLGMDSVSATFSDPRSSSSVHVFNIPHRTTQEHLMQLFKDYEPQSVQIVNSLDPTKSTQALVELANQPMAHQAVVHLDQSLYRGKTLIVAIAYIEQAQSIPDDPVQCYDIETEVPTIVWTYATMVRKHWPKCPLHTPLTGSLTVRVTSLIDDQHFWGIVDFESKAPEILALNQSLSDDYATGDTRQAAGLCGAIYDGVDINRAWKYVTPDNTNKILYIDWGNEAVIDEADTRDISDMQVWVTPPICQPFRLTGVKVHLTPMDTYEFLIDSFSKDNLMSTVELN